MYRRVRVTVYNIVVQFLSIVRSRFFEYIRDLRVINSIYTQRDRLEEMVDKEVKIDINLMQQLHHQYIPTIFLLLKKDKAYGILVLPFTEYGFPNLFRSCIK